MLPIRSVARVSTAAGGGAVPAWKTMPWVRSVPGAGACSTVKLGKVRFVGRGPVLNANGAEVVPLFRTCLMRYVVLGNIPATRKLVLSPGTTGSAAVELQGWLVPAGWNSTCIERAEEGGAVQGDQGVGRRADHRAGPHDSRIRGIGRGRGLAGRGAGAVLDGHLDGSSPPAGGPRGSCCSG